MTSKAKTATPESPELPEPGPVTKEAIERATEKQKARPAPVRVAFKKTGEREVLLSEPHSDIRGWGEHLQETMGTRSSEFCSAMLTQIENMTRPAEEAGGASATRLNAALAVMSAIAPANEHEALIAAHIVGSSELAADCMRRARNNEGPFRESYINQATKLTRTVAVLTESLTKLRSGGKQQVEVRYVYVDARGSQNIIGGMPSGAAWGGDAGNPPQAHEPPAGLEFAPGVPMPSAQPSRDAMPVPGHEGQEAMSPARRQEHRRAHRSR